MADEQWTALGKRKVLEGIEQDAALAGELAEDSDLQEDYHASQKSARSKNELNQGCLQT